MNNITIFSNKEFGQVRIVTINEEPWFVGKDVAEALGYAKARNAIAAHVDAYDKKDAPIQGALGGNQEMTIINESGMYALIFGSKLESAKRFKRWVTSEVLPAIRKTGRYDSEDFENMSTELKAIIMHDRKIQQVEREVLRVDDDLQRFKTDMPILGIEESRITSAVKKKGVDCLGGKNTNAYKDKSLRGRIYSDIYSQLKREFGIASYKAIKRNQCERAIEAIEHYGPPMVLREQIADLNNQVNLVVI